MELTGKAEKDFNKWLIENFESEEQPITVHTSYEGELEVYASDNFYILPFSMRYGVYVDFFDSIGIHISIISKYNYFEYMISCINIASRRVSIKDRYTTRDFSILESNAIYNNNKMIKNKNK